VPCSHPPRAMPCTAKQFEDGAGCPGELVILTAVLCNDGECAAAYEWTVEQIGGAPIVWPDDGTRTLPGLSCGEITARLQVSPISPSGVAILTFTATTAGTDCGPPGGSAGCAAASWINVPDFIYNPVEIRYKTFIHCEVAGPTPAAPWLYDFFGGDNRPFGYSWSVNRSRTFQSCLVTVDPAYPNGQVEEPLQRTGISRGYDDSPPASDVIPLAVPTCGGQCAYTFVPGATAECVAQVPDASGAGMLDIDFIRQDPSTVDVILLIDAADQCETVVPGINAWLTIRFRQRCVNGEMTPVEYRAWGNYDGYPWYEVYLNGSLIFSHDPCLTGDTPNSMFPPPLGTIYQFEVSNPALQNWQPVPGQ